jgi:hypothetical protein
MSSFSAMPIGLPSIHITEEGPVLERSSPDQLLRDLERSFTLRAPREDDTIETLMWHGGQQDVVSWLRHYLDPDNQ